MSTFKEWCAARLGIAEIIEGKVVKQIFIPANNNPTFNLSFVNAQNAKAFNWKGEDGYLVSPQTFSHLKKNLPQNPPLIFKLYNVPAPLYFNVSAAKKQNFLLQFAEFQPIEEFEPLKGNYRIKLQYGALDALYKQYAAENKSLGRDLNSSLDAFKLMKSNITTNNLSGYLNKAQILSMDNDNNSAVNCSIFEASSAYAMSLKIFAELHKKDLSENEYLSLQRAVGMLAAYDSNGRLQQGLKSDSNFMDHIVERLGAERYHDTKPDGSMKLISETSNSNKIIKIMNENIYNLLHGKKNVSLGRKKTFDMKRFLPDSSMQSETNEMVFQGGGMINHSAMFRIIKVGMLKNGTKASLGMKADYFDYFKVETNLGAGCHEAEWTHKTCTGTYITKLLPSTRSINGTNSISFINPVKQPVEYQKQMENTLTELIKAERELFFYRKPQQGPNGEGASPVGSDEAKEWTRLHTIRMYLGGTPVSGPIEYQATTATGAEMTFTVQNQKGYLQEKGSCPIFSIKQLVTSIVGSELAALHSQFLQAHNGNQHLDVIEQQISSLEKLVGGLRNTAELYSREYLKYIGDIQAKNHVPHGLPANFLETVNHYPDLYDECYQATKLLMKDYLQRYATIKGGTESEQFFNNFSITYKTLPAQFQQLLHADYQKMEEIHQLNHKVSLIVGFNTPFDYQRMILKDALNGKGALSHTIVQDLKSLGKFYETKIALHPDQADYKSSLDAFYKKAIDIRLSNQPVQQQMTQIKQAAHDEFHHRHSTRRLIADVVLLCSMLFAGLGVLIGVGKVMQGHTFFFSQAPTARETELTGMMQDVATPGRVFKN